MSEHESDVQQRARRAKARAQVVRERYMTDEELFEYLMSQPAVIDAAHLEHQRAWSRNTFGPGARTRGVLNHIRSELEEIEAAPHDIEEWADLLILAFDGAWRAGHEPQALIDAVKAKQAKNEARTWPDWRTRSEDEAIEHVREEL